MRLEKNGGHTGLLIKWQVRGHAHRAVDAEFFETQAFVDRHGIARNHGETAGIGQRDIGQGGNAAFVALDGNDVLGAFRQKSARQAAGAGTDFIDDGLFAIGGACDAAGEIEVEQKILAERFLGDETVGGNHLAQRRQGIRHGRAAPARASAISAAILIAAIMLR